MDTNIKKDNKIPGCDQLTRPDEIAALSKYLGEIKRVQEEHTSLDKDSLEVPGPSFRDTDHLEDTIINGAPGKDVNLGDQIIGLEKNKEVGLENTKLGIESKDTKTLKTEVQNLNEVNELKELEDRVIGEKIKTNPNLPNTVEELNVNTINELEGEIIGLDTNTTTTLSDTVEELNVNTINELEGEIIGLDTNTTTTLSDTVEGLNDVRNNRLEDAVLGLNANSDPTLSDIVEGLNDDQDNRLGDLITSLPGQETTPNLSSYLDNLDEPPIDLELENKIVEGEELEIYSLEDKTEELGAENIIGGLETGRKKRPGETKENELGNKKLEIDAREVDKLEEKRIEIEGKETENLDTRRLRLLGTRFGKMTEDELYQTLIKLLEEDDSDWSQRMQSLVSAYLSSSTISLDRAREYEDLVARSYAFPGAVLEGIAESEALTEEAYPQENSSPQVKLDGVNEENQLEPGTRIERVPKYKLDSPIVSNLINNGASSYLRQIVESTIGELPLGTSSLRVKLINESLAILFYEKLKMEKTLGTNKDRLPGYPIGMDNSVIDALSNGVSGIRGYKGWDSGAGIIKNLTNIADTIPSFYQRDSDKIPDQPFNRPEKQNEVIISYDGRGFGASYLYDPKTGKLRKGMQTTLEELCQYDTNNIIASNITLEDILKDEKNLYITTAEKVNKGTSLTLDTNMYWEVVMEPYCSGTITTDNVPNQSTKLNLGNKTLNVDKVFSFVESNPMASNGGISFLPSIYEINVINKVEHGFETSYNKWIPISGFELQKSKLTTKSLGLFDGEINYPVTSELTNELRITVIDDQWKSWKHYFQKCSDVSVYNSEPHNRGYYHIKNISRPTAIDKDHLCAAYYKNITFLFKIYIMTPQYSTIRKLELLCVLKDFSEEYSGEVESGGNELNISFSIVGELNYSLGTDTYSGDTGWIDGTKTTEEFTLPPEPPKKPITQEKKQAKTQKKKQEQVQTEVAQNNNTLAPVTADIIGYDSINQFPNTTPYY